MTILLVLIFWELSKIHMRLKGALRVQKESAKEPEEISKVA